MVFTDPQKDNQMKYLMTSSLSKGIKSVQVFLKASKLNVADYVTKTKTKMHHFRAMMSLNSYTAPSLLHDLMKTWPWSVSHHSPLATSTFSTL